MPPTPPFPDWATCGDDMDEPERLNATDARAGATPGVTRYVLAISLVLIVAAFAAMLIIWR